MTLFKILLAVVPLFAFAASPPDKDSSAESARFSRLQVDIWPEFDRQAALVILKGELAPGVALPATVSLRIPASAGSPSAVAFAAKPGGELFNLPYDRTEADGHITLRLTAPQRYIHLEFYDALATGAPERSYTYVWPGDVAVERLNVRLQEPAASSDISVKPELGNGTEGPDGLLYRTADLGAYSIGQRLPVEVRYTKRNSRTSAEILGMSSSNPAPQVASAPARPLPAWVLGLASALIVSMAAVGGVLWWTRRQTARAGAAGGAAFCRQCGNRLDSGDRYCSKCGTPLRKR